ncbi:tRNA glutamyl-Q(34) synthetase GluQRS [Kushneria phosphatilytica]|uniref:Glutamyl-Q tRNA(Asp) synthetase n=1 Tax=Kushneria phosphatilytica TaxID=657387 RepID=A0A1S1NWD2_9GAMM|nr:tRNA glutamyl-Q(34) synthetase GluQRS [Kushneria phosphatilytica]OHV11246.1 tRNA glutamyl-Q(34) synthetase GluQRS [Kushneria phosphatilytica]QEL12179.1 tRNA glutamyl-Q(34) synthetase GluQRS [Kushneria phosphatilytica]
MPRYIGRFAPTPSGPLHFGSLIAALASWLDARSVNGCWYLRIEDVDTPRSSQQAIDTIRRQLEAFGLYYDGPIMYQHTRHEAYRQALERLRSQGMAYPCSCTRRELSGYQRYPGWCRQSPRQPDRDLAWRLRTDIGASEIVWEDRRLGRQCWPLDHAGDVILRRRDGIWAYQLAVVVDDADQQITDIVRGMDLLDNTPWQRHLQLALGMTAPRYLHLPLIVAANGQKLSKQNLAPALPVEGDAPRLLLHRALTALGQQPAEELADYPVAQQLAWAATHWSTERLGCTDQWVDPGFS